VPLIVRPKAESGDGFTLVTGLVEPTILDLTTAGDTAVGIAADFHIV